METIKTISDSFSRAKNHLGNLQKMNWQGRSVVSYFAVGGIVLVVSLIVRAIFSRSQEKSPAPSPNKKEEKDNSRSLVIAGIRAEEFCSSHEILLKSPLAEKIEKIYEIQAIWKEESTSMMWDRRIRVIKEQISSLLAVLEKESTSSYRVLDEIQDQLGKVNTYELYQKFQTQMNTLMADEERLKNQFLIRLQQEFDKIQVASPSYCSVEAYLSSLGIETQRDYSDILECNSSALANRGIADLADLKILGIYRFDKDLLQLQCFQCFFNLYSLGVGFSLKPVMQSLQQFFKVLARKIGEEKSRDHLTTLKNFEDQSTRLIKLLETSIEPPNCLRQLQEITESFQAWNLLRRQSDLKGYIHQIDCAATWKLIKKTSSPDYTLKNYCTDSKIDLLGIYHLSQTVDQNLLAEERSGRGNF